jgi:predicted metal-dependent peptidase
MTIPDKLQFARIILSQKLPYFNTALWAMRFREEPRCPTMGSDKYWRVYYNPDLLEKLPQEQVTGLVCHEMYHLIRAHCDTERLGGRDPRIWNFAADSEINPGIKQLFALPDWGVFPEKFGLVAGEPVEIYYDQLYKNAKKIKCHKHGNPGKDGGGCGGQLPPSGGAPSQGDKGEPCPDCPPQCGSGAGNAQPWEEGYPSDGDGVVPVEGGLIRQQVAKDIKDSVGRGNVPGEWEMWANLTLNPSIPWQKQLSAMVRRGLGFEQGKMYSTYVRQSRRQGGGEFILPVFRKPIIVVAVLIDTSGSVGDDTIAQFMGEMRGILSNLTLGAWVVPFDAAVHSPRKVTNVNKIKIEGRGGTDARVAFKYVDENIKPLPTIVVVLTDGDTPWPERPRYQTIVALSKECEGVPEWARKLLIKL